MAGLFGLKRSRKEKAALVRGDLFYLKGPVVCNVRVQTTLKG